MFVLVEFAHLPLSQQYRHLTNRGNHL
ncbi:hypothetical protein D049_1866A, partial [Vibrio parahaemolyticus VPTS-2010]